MNEKGLELKVGLFIVVGLGVLLAMLIYFGRLGEGIQHYYNLTVEFPNASGLLKGSVVYYGGAEIGRVADHPQITNSPKLLDESTGVIIKLKIEENVKIPQDSKFIIGSSGLLGDRFVDVIAPDKFEKGKYIAPESLLSGMRIAGIEDITREGTELLRELRGTVQKIDEAIVQVNNGVLKEENIKALDATMQNIKKTSEDIAGFQPKLENILTRTETAMQNAEEAMQTAKEAMDSGKVAVEDIHRAIQKGEETMDIAKQLIEEGLSGQGLLGQLMDNKELADDFESLIANLRRHGVLFYRDQSDKKTQPSSSQRLRPAPSRLRGRGF